MDAQQRTCPAPDLLRAFGLGDKVDPADVEFVTHHLEACGKCSAEVAAVSANPFLARRRAVTQRSRTPASTMPMGNFDPSITTRPGEQIPVPVSVADPIPAELADNPEFEIVRELGRGGMGVVYLARNRLMGREEVLKVMGPAVIALPGAADRFRREIQSAAQLDHRNIVRAYSARQFGDQLVLAMEYVPGSDLSGLVKSRGPLPVLNACHYAQQVANGLQHAHEHGMVHRDVKPANLLVHRNGRRHTVKILDFGLAKVTSEAGRSAELTGSGQMMGTPLYMAPEQARDAASADVRADVFSLGCTLYFLLAGRPPLAGGVLAVLADEQARPLWEIRPDMPEELSRVVATMMAKDPRRRYQTPADVVTALAPLLKLAARPAPPPAAPVALAVPEVPVAPAAVRTGPPVAGPEPAPVDPWWSELTISEPTEAPKEAGVPAARRLPRWAWPAFAAAVLVVGLLAAWAGGALRTKTRDGMIVLEKLPPDAQVLVDGESVSVTRNGNQATVSAVRSGPHRLRVVQAGIEILSSDVTVLTGGAPVRVPVEPPSGLAGANEDSPTWVFDLSGKANPPDGFRLAETKAKLQGAYTAELVSTKPQDRTRLARTMMERASALPADETDLRFALLSLAGDVAVEASDFGTALESCNETYKWFAVDPIRIKTELLTGAFVRLLNRLAPSPLEDLAEAAVTVGFEALAAYRYKEANVLARMSGQAAGKAPASHLVYQAVFLEQEAIRTGQWFDRVKQAIAATTREPADPRSNAEAGAFLCLAKNEWDKGLALLSSGDDPVLVALAEREIKKPMTSADQIALGDLWWESAVKAAAAQQTDFRRRARHWYLKGLAGTDLPDRRDLAKRLVPRIDSVPTRPVTLRIRLERFFGRHTLRLSNDGVSHTSSHGGLRMRVNHLRFPLGWRTGGEVQRENSGAGRLFPDGTDFSGADIVREEISAPATLWFQFGIDSLTIHALNSTAGDEFNLDLTVTLQAGGFASANRMSGLWDVNCYKLDGTTFRADRAADWADAIAGKPLARVTRDRIDFAACERNPFDERLAPPIEGIPHDWFGLVGTSDWVTPGGQYEVRTLVDDGVRVFIDDRKVIDNWKPQGPSRSQTELRLTQGTHRIRIEYFQAERLARLQFSLRRIGD